MDNNEITVQVVLTQEFFRRLNNENATAFFVEAAFDELSLQTWFLAGLCEALTRDEKYFPIYHNNVFAGSFEIIQK